MHCAVYIRKSREDKNKPAHRLTAQREQLPAYATSQGWAASTYDDGHASAARGKTEALLERSRLEQDIRAGKIDIVLVIELSRLSRDDTLEDYLTWLNLCADHNVKLATMSRILDPAQHSDWMLLLMEGGFSSVEMKVLRSRMNEGRQQAMLSGKWLGGTPPPPYIYDRDQRRPIVDLGQLHQMQQLWQLAENTSAKKIAETLNMPEIAVRRAISDERLLIYQAKRLNKDNGEIITCDWEPVMAADQAERIRAGRRTRKTNSVRREAAGLFSAMGLLFCGYCGRTVKTWNNSKIRKNGTRLDYYGCQVKNRKNACPKSRMIAQTDFDGRMLTNIFGTIRQLDRLKKYWEINKDKNAGDEISRLKKEQDSLQSQKSNLIDAVAAGAMDISDIKDKMAEIKKDLQKIEIQIQGLKANKTGEPDWQAIAFTWEEYDSLTLPEQRQFLQAVIKKITLFQNYAIIEYPFPKTEKGDNLSRVHLPSPRIRKRNPTK